MNLITRARNRLLKPSQPTNIHSLENLQYLYDVLERNRIVSDANRELLTETLRSISEILIWGDQNDSSVIDYCYEKGIMKYFLNFMRQQNGRYICAQILQTLSILFENIRDEASLYYLLSNNLMNNIIVHKFDFNDEEITAYYISFLKTLSLKLNRQSIHLFFNEREKDFPLYVEAIKFFNHSETMVRIAVRTLTLNVYRVPDCAMHRFILDCTATEYFSNLVWFIRNHILDFDHCIRNHQNVNRGYLTASLEEYVDHIYYLQDIFLLNVDSLNNILKDQLINRLAIPIYVLSLVQQKTFNGTKVSLHPVSNLFLLAEVFLVIHYRPVVEELADLILSADKETVEAIQQRFNEQIFYNLPPASLDICLAKSEPNETLDEEIHLNVIDINNEEDCRRYEDEQIRAASISLSPVDEEVPETPMLPTCSLPSNWTDDEKCKRRKESIGCVDHQFTERPFFAAIVEALDYEQDDQLCFYALSVLITLSSNPSIDNAILESVGLTVKSSKKSSYNTLLVDRLCDILEAATKQESNIRIVTLTLAITFLQKLVYNENEQISYLSSKHFARIEQTRRQATKDLQRYYKQQELFLDMFEDEYRQMQINPMKIDYLLKDTCMLYPPSTTPLSGIELIKRLPSGDIERTRRSLRVFFLIRKLTFDLNSTIDTNLPLTKVESVFKLNDTLDLNNCDLIACTVHFPDRKDRRYLVIDQMQFILVEPDNKQVSWGIVKFSHLIQDVEVMNDKEDSHSLFITIHKPAENIYVKTNPPILSAKFTFDDHMRCLTAKKNLLKSRQKAREMKSEQIASILEVDRLTPQTSGMINVDLGEKK